MRVSYETLLCEVQDQMATVTLNRSEGAECAECAGVR